MKGSAYAVRWLFGTLVGIAALIVGAVLSDIKQGIKDTRTDITAGMTEIKADVRDVKSIALPTAYKVEALQSEMNSLKERVKEIADARR